MTHRPPINHAHGCDARKGAGDESFIRAIDIIKRELFLKSRNAKIARHTQDGSAGDAGVKMECRAFPLEPGFKYVCTLDMKGAGYRIYFSGYQFAPGVRPHENPELGELREIYKSKATVGSSAEWKQEKIEIPGVKLSPQATEALRKVRYLTVYIWMAKPGFVDNVTVTKVADPTMKF